MKDDQKGTLPNSTASPKAKSSTPKSLYLTPSEIASLRQDQLQASERAKELIAADKAKQKERPGS